MSLNITPLTEISRSVVGCKQLVVSTADLISGFPILAPDGSLGAPTYSFVTNTDSGLFRSSDGVAATVDGEVGLLAGLNGNVAVGGVPSNYGSGQGVLFLADAAVKPIGIPNAGSGGILYVDGSELNFLDSTGMVVTLTTPGGSDVSGPSSSTDTQLATFESLTGNIITNSGVRYTSSQLLTGDGSKSVPSYAFTSEPNTGVFLDTSTIGFSTLGALRLSLNASTATFGVPFSKLSPTSAAAPGFSFASSTSSGVFYGANHLQISSGGDAGLAFGGVSSRNVSVGGPAPGYGTGADGVLFIPTATTNPVGVPNGGSGGVMYSTGNELRWLDSAGTSILLGGSVSPVVSSVDGQLAVWGNTSGSVVVTGPIVTDTGVICAVQSVTLANPAYSFTASTGAGMVLSSTGVVSFQGTTSPALTVSSSSVTSPIPFRVSTSGISSPGISFSSSTDSGISSSGGDQRFAVGVYNVFSVRENSNIGIGDINNSYGSGQGVVRLSDATTPPSSAPTNGGFIYVTGTSLLFRDTDNLEHTLTSTTSVSTVASSTDNGVVRFDTTDGKIVQDSTGIFISDSGQVTTVGAEGYSFTSSGTSGVSSSAPDTLELVNAGVTSLTVSTSEVTVATGHVVTVADGVALTPSFSFISDPDTGMYLSSPDTVSLSAGGVHGMSVDSNANVSLGSDTPDFAGGNGVVYISDVITPPSGTLSNGGLLYVSGRNAFFHDMNGVSSQLSGVEGLGSSIDNRIVTMSGTLGKSVTQSGFALSATDQITGPDGVAATPSYRVTSGGSAGWFYGGANTIELGNGANQLSLNSTAMTASVQIEPDSSLRIGGVGGMTETFSTPTTTRNVANAIGTFELQQNGTPILQTNAVNDVNLLSNFAVCTGGTGDFTIGHDGISFDLDVANAADSLVFAVGGTTQATFTSTGITASNIAAKALGLANSFNFTASPTSGLTPGTSSLRVNGNVGLKTFPGGRVTFFDGPTFVSSSTTSIKVSVTAPTSAPTSGAYLYLHSGGEFVRVANKDVDVAVNGPMARAKISRTQTITSGAIDLIDTLIDVESNMLVVDTAAPGVGTITGTADTAGWWEISAEAHWVSNATGFRRVRIKVGGVVVGDSTENAVTGIETQHQVRVCVNVAASAVVTFEVEQNSGVGLSVDVIGTVVFLG